jgi:predicted nucleic acid-binding Zn ribbon protein
MNKNQTPIKLLYAAPVIRPDSGKAASDEPVEEQDAPGVPYPANYTEPEGPDTNTLMEDVYDPPEMPYEAGPEEPCEAEEPKQPETDIPMAPVYAGPKFFERRDSRKRMECVYAGPEYFEQMRRRREQAEREAEEKELKEEIERNKLFEAVYAVPESELQNTPIMMTYAGPQVRPNFGLFDPGASAPDPEKKPAGPGYCPVCGGKVSETARFCETCGAKLERGEAPKPEPSADGTVSCPNCGTALPEGSPFCSECGTPIARKPAPAVGSAEPEKPADEKPETNKGANEPVFQSVYACPPLMKKGGKQLSRQNLISRLFKKKKE